MTRGELFLWGLYIGVLLTLAYKAHQRWCERVNRTLYDMQDEIFAMKHPEVIQDGAEEETDGA